MSGIVAFWHMNEASWNGIADEVRDASGNGFHGTSNGGASTTSGGPFGRAGAFVGNGVDFGQRAAFDNLPLSTWIKVDDISLTNGMVGIEGLYKLDLNNGNGTVRFLYGTGAGWCSIITSSQTVSPGTWHHIAATMNGSVGKIYINGNLDPNTGGACVLGSNANQLHISPWNAYYGLQAELAIWSRAMGPSEVLQLYRRGANRIKYQVRSCSDSACEYKNDASTPANWIWPDGTDQSFFSELNNIDTYNTASNTANGTVLSGLPSLDFTKFGAGLSAALSTNRYFQYRAILESDDANNLCDYGSGPSTASCSPELKAVSVGPDHYSKDHPYIIGKNGVAFARLSSFTQTLGTSCDGAVKYQLSLDKTNWQWWSGTSWQSSTDTTTAQANTATQLNTAGVISTFAGPGTVYFRAFLGSDGSQACELDSVTISGAK